MWRYVVGALLALHGLIHATGLAASWQLGDRPDVTAAPSVASLRPGSPIVLVLGVLWLIAGAAFVARAMKASGDYRAWTASEAWAGQARAALIIASAVTRT